MILSYTLVLPMALFQTQQLMVTHRIFNTKL